MNKVTIEPIKREVKLEVIHIESEFHYAHPGQVVEEPKERGT